MPILLEGDEKDIRKYIANCILCWLGKAKVQQYPLQITEIPDRPFDKIVIDLVTECETSTSGNNHLLTIIDHLTRWPEAFPIPDKSADTIVATFINEYYQYTYAPDIFFQTMDRIPEEPHGPSSATAWHW